MIGQELSFYPSTDAEQQRLAEQLSRTPEAFERSLGNAALNDTTQLLVMSFTGGVLEPAPTNTTPHERQFDTSHEKLQQKLATSALSSMIIRQRLIHEAIAYQNEFDQAA